MNTPPVHKSRAQLPTWVVVALTIMVIIASVLYVFISLYYPYRGEVVEETLIVPVNAEIFTTNHYSGIVTITVSGQGQIDSRTHNAFTIFNPVGYNEGFHGFTIDGEPLLFRVFTIQPTPINPLIHQYRFTYYVGDEERRIKFLIDNGNLQDNSSFIVEVSSLNKVHPPSGR